MGFCNFRLKSRTRNLAEHRVATRATLIEELYHFIPPGTDLSRELGNLVPQRLRGVYAEVGEQLALLEEAFVELDDLDLVQEILDSSAPSAQQPPQPRAAQSHGDPAAAPTLQRSPVRTPFLRGHPAPASVGTCEDNFRSLDEITRLIAATGVELPSEDMEDDQAATTATFQLAMNELKLLCKDLNVGEGGHGIAKKGQYPELPSKVNPKGGVIQGHGQQWRLLCSANGKASSSQIWLERVKGGVAVAPKSTFTHKTHELARNATEKAAAAAAHDEIPTDVLDEAQTWFARVPLFAVVDILRDKFTVDGKKPDWSLKDFANKLAPTVAKLTLEATRFVAELIEMRTSGLVLAQKLHLHSQLHPSHM
ncbi:hypothetical protein T492DRAFT_850836 [Pavlovales sp. CCMP2436]|nr:hypothetical protein T492DRAFT_850836 [Pavlovales sp. CCMP2436]